LLRATLEFLRNDRRINANITVIATRGVKSKSIFALEECLPDGNGQWHGMFNLMDDYSMPKQRGFMMMAIESFSNKDALRRSNFFIENLSEITIYVTANLCKRSGE
jgi:hypothetical protein